MRVTRYVDGFGVLKPIYPSTPNPSTKLAFALRQQPDVSLKYAAGSSACLYILPSYCDACMNCSEPCLDVSLLNRLAILNIETAVLYVFRLYRHFCQTLETTMYQVSKALQIHCMSIACTTTVSTQSGLIEVLFL